MKEPQNERQIKFLDLLVDGTRTVAEAAADTGYPTSYAYTILKEYKEYFMDRVLGKIVLHAPSAANTLIEGLRELDPIKALTLKGRFDFAKDILDRGGFAKRDKVDVTVSDAGGLFILPAKEKEGEPVNG